MFSCHCVCSLHAPSHSCVLTLGDPMDYSPPASSIHGIFQARILEQVAIYSIRSPQLTDWICTFCIGKWILSCHHFSTVLTDARVLHHTCFIDGDGEAQGAKGWRQTDSPTPLPPHCSFLVHTTHFSLTHPWTQLSLAQEVESKYGLFC